MGIFFGVDEAKPPQMITGHVSGGAVSGTGPPPDGHPAGFIYSTAEVDQLTERAFGPRPEQTPEWWDNNRMWIDALFASVRGDVDLIHQVVIHYQANRMFGVPPVCENCGHHLIENDEKVDVPCPKCGAMAWRAAIPPCSPSQERR
jgi:predicted RNA-binding Zn-ribbon protein involved in translation (DUF1610 family)